MGKVDSFLIDNYKKCWKFLGEFKLYAWIGFSTFLLFAIIGFVFPVFFVDKILEIIQNLINQIQGFNLFEMIVFIFLNNIQVAIIAIVLGVFFGVVPFFMVLVNGYLVGFISQRVVAQEGVFVLWKLLPHGVFEIPAFLLCIGIGLKIGTCIFHKDWKKKLKWNFIEGLRFFVFVVFPLLLIAGIIEGLLMFLV